MRLAQVSGTATVVPLATAQVKTVAAGSGLTSAVLGQLVQAGGTDHEMKDARNSNSSGEDMSVTEDNGPHAMDLAN